MRPTLLTLAATLAGPAQAVFYKIGSTAEIKESARTLAYDMSSYYKGNQTGQTVGILPGPPDPDHPNPNAYYWYVAGAMFGTFIDYWHVTGDNSYNKMVTDGMIAQIGERQNYEPANWTLSLGNDDQAFWGMAALSAAENKFPNPPPDQPTWIDLAHSVWNMQHGRLDNQCGGGLHWQAQESNKGYKYKNVIANACFINMGARLARYTGNNTFITSADEIWDWMWGLNYIDHKTWTIYDGAYTTDNCQEIDRATYSANGAVLIEAVAYLYNYTEGADRQKWGGRLDNLLDRFLVNNFNDSIAYEPNCEPWDKCKTDQKCMKGYSHRWLSVTTQLAPHTKPKIQPVLAKSVQAAVNQCTGGPTGRKCGFMWREGVYVDPEKMSAPTTGACETMSVFGAVISMLFDNAPTPVTLQNGGISNSTNDIYKNKTPIQYSPITTADKAGAAIITILVLLVGISPMVWADR